MAYQTGKFRDAHFYTVSDTTTFGRRGPTYELPYDEKGVAGIDLGRAARRFQINAILMEKRGGGVLSALAGGLQSFTQLRDKLIKAVETPGVGQLVHPNFGPVMVRIQKDSLQITNSTENGEKFCEVTFSCIEARDPLPPGGQLAGLINAAQDARDAAGDSLAARLLTEGPDFLLADVNEVLDDTIAALRRSNAVITSFLEAPGNFARRIDNISREIANLLDTPRRLFDAIDGFVELLSQAAGRVYDASKQEEVASTIAASKITDNALVLVSPPDPIFGSKGLGNAVVSIPLAFTTPTRQQQRVNRAALSQSFKASALANAAGALALTPPTSRTEALETSARLSAAILELADGSVEGQDVPAELYDALKDLAAALQDYTDRIAGRTSNVRVHVVASAIPVEVLAYQLYGDAERAAEILARNPHIVHGGIIPGHTQLEVLDR
jgi:prophage DNA circulation protein